MKSEASRLLLKYGACHLQRCVKSSNLQADSTDARCADSDIGNRLNGSFFLAF